MISRLSITNNDVEEVYYVNKHHEFSKIDDEDNITTFSLGDIYQDLGKILNNAYRVIERSGVEKSKLVFNVEDDEFFIFKNDISKHWLKGFLQTSKVIKTEITILNEEHNKELKYIIIVPPVYSELKEKDLIYKAFNTYIGEFDCSINDNTIEMDDDNFVNCFIDFINNKSIDYKDIDYRLLSDIVKPINEFKSKMNILSLSQLSKFPDSLLDEVLTDKLIKNIANYNFVLGYLESVGIYHIYEQVGDIGDMYMLEEIILNNFYYDTITTKFKDTILYNIGEGVRYINFKTIIDNMIKIYNFSKKCIINEWEVITNENEERRCEECPKN